MKIPLIVIGAVFGGVVAYFSASEKKADPVAPVVAAVVPDALPALAAEVVA